MNQRLFAIWHYDTFPYCLGDEVEELKSGGWVRVKNYGGACYKYLKLLPYNEGKELLDRIYKISAEYQKHTKEYHDEKLAEVKTLLET